jgi:hypothetical protein
MNNNSSDLLKILRRPMETQCSSGKDWKKLKTDLDWQG